MRRAGNTTASRAIMIQDKLPGKRGGQSWSQLEAMMRLAACRLAAWTPLARAWFDRRRTPRILVR